MSDAALEKMRSLFSSYRLDDDAMIEVIRTVFDDTGYLLDPHTAIGVEAARKVRRRTDIPMVCLATASPAKFPEAARKAGQTEDPALPQSMQDLFDREERYSVLPNDLTVIQQFVTQNTRP